MPRLIETLRKLPAHPRGKATVAATLLAIGAGLLYERMGGDSPLIMFLVCLGVYAMADWRLVSRGARQVRIGRIATFCIVHRAPLIQCGLYVLLCAFFLGTLSIPSEDTVKAVFSLVHTFGIVAVLLGPFVVSFWKGTLTLVGMLSRFLAGLSAYTIALWSIGAFGDSLYAVIQHEPRDAAVAGAALGIVWLIARVSWATSQDAQAMPMHAVTAARSASLTARDERYVAAHEAGHALVYAALRALPDDIRLEVGQETPGSRTLGSVTARLTEHCLDDRSFAEWRMMSCLAGTVGEWVMLGEPTLGGIDDQQRWVSLARQYLANQFRGMYYAAPGNLFEHARNEAQLAALRAEQLEMLHRLFEMNTPVLRELAAQALQMRSLARDDLLPFLSRVRLPERFPTPYGPLEASSPAGQSHPSQQGA